MRDGLHRYLQPEVDHVSPAPPIKRRASENADGEYERASDQKAEIIRQYLAVKGLDRREKNRERVQVDDPLKLRPYELNRVSDRSQKERDRHDEIENELQIIEEDLSGREKPREAASRNENTQERNRKEPEMQGPMAIPKDEERDEHQCERECEIEEVVDQN